MKKSKVKVGKNSRVTVVDSSISNSKDESKKIRWDWIAIISCIISILTYVGLSWEKISNSIVDNSSTNEKIKLSQPKIDSTNTIPKSVKPHIIRKPAIVKVKAKTNPTPSVDTSAIKISNLAIFGSKSVDNSKPTTGVKGGNVILKNVLIAGFDNGVEAKGKVNADSTLILKEMPKFKENQ